MPHVGAARRPCCLEQRGAQDAGDRPGQGLPQREGPWDGWGRGFMSTAATVGMLLLWVGWGGREDAETTGRNQVGGHADGGGSRTGVEVECKRGKKKHGRAPWQASCDMCALLAE